MGEIQYVCLCVYVCGGGGGVKDMGDGQDTGTEDKGIAA